MSSGGFVDTEYGGDYQLLREAAEREYSKFLKHTINDEPHKFSGPLQCYCKAAKMDHPDDLKKLSKISYNNQNKEKVYENVRICQEYTLDTYHSKVLGAAISFFIVSVNILLK